MCLFGGVAGYIQVLKSCRFWGVTPPISVAASSEREREVTASLMEELRRQNMFETEEESRRRCAIMLLDGYVLVCAATRGPL